MIIRVLDEYNRNNQFVKSNERRYSARETAGTGQPHADREQDTRQNVTGVTAPGTVNRHMAALAEQSSGGRWPAPDTRRPDNFVGHHDHRSENPNSHARGPRCAARLAACLDARAGYLLL